MKTLLVIASSCAAVRELEQEKIECDFENVRSFCSFTKNVLMISDCDDLASLVPDCMTINRGPPGYKMVHADVTECETFTGINESGFFVFGNQLNNGFKFQCESIVNSKVAIHSGFTDGDSEHGEDYAKVKIIELKKQSVTTDNDIDTITFNLDTSAMKAPGNIQFGS